MRPDEDHQNPKTRPNGRTAGPAGAASTAGTEPVRTPNISSHPRPSGTGPVDGATVRPGRLAASPAVAGAAVPGPSAALAPRSRPLGMPRRAVAHPARSYVATRVLTAPPQVLVLMLMDGVLREVARALQVDVKARGGRERLHRALTRAQDFLRELMLALDHERGGELAARLSALYLFCQERLIEANVKGDARLAADAVRVLVPIREAWAALCSGRTGSREPAGGPDRAAPASALNDRNDRGVAPTGRSRSTTPDPTEPLQPLQAPPPSPGRHAGVPAPTRPTTPPMTSPTTPPATPPPKEAEALGAPAGITAPAASAAPAAPASPAAPAPSPSPAPEPEPPRPPRRSPAHGGIADARWGVRP